MVHILFGKTEEFDAYAWRMQNIFFFVCRLRAPRVSRGKYIYVDLKLANKTKPPVKQNTYTHRKAFIESNRHHHRSCSLCGDFRFANACNKDFRNNEFSPSVCTHRIRPRCDADRMEWSEITAIVTV